MCSDKISDEDGLYLTQTMLSEIIGVSPSRVSEYLTGKSEPTFKVARNICNKLDISPTIVFGV
ncbi:MAG: helix-turn-helix transcriptional regulator [Prolixibacteraceae bacterium]